MFEYTDINCAKLISIMSKVSTTLKYLFEGILLLPGSNYANCCENKIFEKIVVGKIGLNKH